MVLSYLLAFCCISKPILSEGEGRVKSDHLPAQGHVKVAAFQTVGAPNSGKSEMARPPLPVPVLPGWHPRRRHVMPKCPKNAAWPRQNVTTLNQNVRYLNQNVRFLSVNLFCDHLFSITWWLCS
jgi:hypothetical protein